MRPILARYLGLGLLLAGCVTPPTKPPPSPPLAATGARDALLAFVAAAEAGRFDECYRNLAGPLRARYTPDRLASDFHEAAAVAKERLARAKAAADAQPTGDDSQATFPIGGDKAVRLVRDDGVWRIAALE
jgi:hypothetical protein